MQSTPSDDENQNTQPLQDESDAEQPPDADDHPDHAPLPPATPQATKAAKSGVQQRDAQQRDAQQRDAQQRDWFTACTLTRKITMKMHMFETADTKYFRDELIRAYEGKCAAEGYICPDTIQLLTCTTGVIERGNRVTVHAVFTCQVCMFAEGMLVECLVKNVTKAGIRAEIVPFGGSKAGHPTPAVVFIAREHTPQQHLIDDVPPYSRIRVRVIGHRFELNDAYISIIGEVVQNHRAAT